MSAALLLLVLCVTPDVRTEPWLADGQESAGVQRVAASAADLARVRVVLAHQDECLLAHKPELAQRDFADDFQAPDCPCPSCAQFLKRWDEFLSGHDEVSLVSELVGAERVGRYLVADVRHPFKGVRRCDGVRVERELCDTIVLRDAEESLKISALHDRDGAHAGRIDRARRRYGVDALAFSVALPEPFVAIARNPPGAALDELLLVDPEHEALMGLTLLEPSIPLVLETALRCDLADDDAQWLRLPEPLDVQAGLRAIYGEVRMPAEPDARPAGVDDKGNGEKGPCKCAAYATPDGKLLFGFWLKAPASSFARCSAKLRDLVRSLRIESREGEPEGYKELLLARNPRWQTLGSDGVFRCEGVPPDPPLEFKVPRGLIPSPLAGDRILRLRLELAEDASTFLVRVFPDSCLLVDPEVMLQRSVDQLFGSVCAQGQREMRRSTETIEVLGRPARSMTLEVACNGGDRRAYRIVAFDMGENRHVQVQLFPNSSHREVHEQFMRLVLDSFGPEK